MTHIKSYVIRQARMSDSQRRHLEEHLHKYRLDYRPDDRSLGGILPSACPVVVEIGFGMGDATAELALADPETLFIGIEVHRPGIGKLVRAIEESDIHNIRIIQHDAVEVLRDMVPPDSLDGIHVFFPDPWQKKRHHKRRLLQAGFVHEAAARLKPGGYLYAVTDWEDYAEQILQVCSHEPLLENQADGFHPPLSWRPNTAFERKGLEKDHRIREVFFRKKRP
ncbi:tRNA (guanosine(46)-N7)-methyltransferase TrmB [Spirochaeta africana]|uniref:tRNA (guanine-N(7)-)-methyltransferase n=1 Tax=Spirochaeta africana (strain ATCC 700263 / DSM 8902 / Z-7692) TaxID=889378 RepID=H9UJ42_SPIAZ|nr:tRNA (guanosine(46)-N7)-methyltransferase TrmB [Spirochaeta africana]AFG37535.1 tRNA (guanine-N(7)-)-methyltransferase [Spirochaeta africana DSM 8902]